MFQGVAQDVRQLLVGVIPIANRIGHRDAGRHKAHQGALTTDVLVGQVNHPAPGRVGMGRAGAHKDAHRLQQRRARVGRVYRVGHDAPVALLLAILPQDRPIVPHGCVSALDQRLPIRHQVSFTLERRDLFLYVQVHVPAHSLGYLGLVQAHGGRIGLVINHFSCPPLGKGRDIGPGLHKAPTAHGVSLAHRQRLGRGEEVVPAPANFGIGRAHLVQGVLVVIDHVKHHARGQAPRAAAPLVAL